MEYAGQVLNSSNNYSIKKTKYLSIPLLQSANQKTTFYKFFRRHQCSVLKIITFCA